MLPVYPICNDVFWLPAAIRAALPLVPNPVLSELTAAPRSSENPSTPATFPTVSVWAPNVAFSRIAPKSTAPVTVPTAFRYTVPLTVTVAFPTVSVARPLVPVPSVSNTTFTLPLFTPAVPVFVRATRIVLESVTPAPSRPRLPVVTTPLDVPKATFSFSLNPSANTAFVTFKDPVPNTPPSRTFPSNTWLLANTPLPARYTAPLTFSV